MNTKELPTDDLKKYGILNPDNSFTKKLNYDEVQKFLEGQALVADNEKNRVVFKLIENKTELSVNLYQRDKNIKDIIDKSKDDIQYSTVEFTGVYSEEYSAVKDKFAILPGNKVEETTINGLFQYEIESVNPMDDSITIRYINNDTTQDISLDFFKKTYENPTETNIINILLNEDNRNKFRKEIDSITKDRKTNPILEYKAFVFDKDSEKVVEYDLESNSEELLEIVEQKNDLEESNKFKVELLKLKGYLQDKVDKFPNMAKEILVDLNIVSKTINSVDGLVQNQEIAQKQKQTKIGLDVNDPDTYQDANRLKEQEQREEQEKKRGFRR